VRHARSCRSRPLRRATRSWSSDTTSTSVCRLFRRRSRIYEPWPPPDLLRQGRARIAMGRTRLCILAAPQRSSITRWGWQASSHMRLHCPGRPGTRRSTPLGSLARSAPPAPHHRGHKVCHGGLFFDPRSAGVQPTTREIGVGDTVCRVAAAQPQRRYGLFGCNTNFGRP
jgi:hypothetical protein